MTKDLQDGNCVGESEQHGDSDGREHSSGRDKKCTYRVDLQRASGRLS